MSIRLKQLYRKLLKKLPDKIVLNIENLRGYHKFVNFKNPKYFGEKIQWLKIYGNLERFSDYVDKYKVREYVAKKIGKEYLIPLINVYDSTDEIDYEKLPDSFVLKLNTGSGYNYIVKNKNKINVTKVNKILNQWLSEDYYKIKKEYQYKDIPKKILCEKLINDKNEQLEDYKFYCFNGKVEFIEVDFNRFENHKMNFYDLNWNLVDMRKGKLENKKINFPKPKNFDRMVRIAQILSENFAFVRVDLYNNNGKIYFGELTFTPAGGLTPFKPLKKDIEIAKLLDIKKYKCPNVLLISSTSKQKNRLDGVTIKSRMLEKYLYGIKDIHLISVDSDDYFKRFLEIIFKIITNLFKTDSVVICSSSPGASKLLKFLRLIHYKKDIYYFVAGGVLGDKIISGDYDIKNYKNLKRIFVESSAMKIQLQNLGLKNVEKMNNFRYIEPFQNNYKTNNCIKFVFWARVIPKKGIEDAIKVINLINKNTKNIVSLDIYGQCEHEYLNKLRKLFNDHIIYHGPITPNGVREYEELSKYDILLFPTLFYEEGLPGTIIDAYIASLAVIASEWKYSREYICDGENGYIFKFGDFDDFYNKTLKILDYDKISKFKLKSKKISKSYDASYVLEKFKNMLLK